MNSEGLKGKGSKCQTEWWNVPIIPELKRPRQEDWKFETSLGYISGLFLSQTRKRKKKNSFQADKVLWSSIGFVLLVLVLFF